MLDDLKELLGAEPFIAFRVILTSGTQYDVLSPYQIAIGKTQLDYYFPKSDKRATVRQDQLVAFETLTNGEKPRRPRRR